MANSSVAARQFLSAQGVVDANGNCEIDLPDPPVNQIYTGSVTVYDSPLGIIWTVILNGLPIDVLSSGGTAAQIQIGTNDSLIITASGLPVGQTFHAAWTVITTPSDDTELIIPGHDSYVPQSIPPQAVISSGNFLFPASAGPIGTAFFFVPPWAKSITVLTRAGFSPSTHNVVIDMQSGGVTSLLGSSFTETLAAGAGFFPSGTGIPWTSPLYGAVDTQGFVQFSLDAASTIPGAASRFFYQIIASATDANPGIVSPTDPNPRTNHDGFGNLVPTGGAVTTILNAPPTGFMWEVVSLSMSTGAATTAVSPIHVMGLTTSHNFWIANFAVGTVISASLSQGAAMYLNEGMSVAQSTGVTVTVIGLVRAVPISGVIV